MEAAQAFACACHTAAPPRGCLGAGTPLGSHGVSSWGAFPAIGLAKARDLARERREEVRQGCDPVREAREARRQASQARADVATLAALLDGYAKDVGSRRRSWPEARRRIESVFAKHLEHFAG